MVIEAERLMKKMQEYMLAYTEHARCDYDYDKLLSKDEVAEITNYLKSALCKAEALYEAWDSLECVQDDIINKEPLPDEFEVCQYGGFDEVPLVRYNNVYYSKQEAEQVFNELVTTYNENHDEDVCLIALKTKGKIIKWQACIDNQGNNISTIQAIITYLVNRKIIIEE